MQTVQKTISKQIRTVDIDSIKKVSSYKWQKTDDYFSEEFKAINKLSYFSYNRDKVYFRTNKLPRKKRKQTKKRILKPNEIIEIFPKECPKCKTQSKKNLSNRLNQSSKLVVDMKFMRYSLKRWIIKYQKGVVKCKKCQHKFSPKHIRYLKSYGLNLKKYCVNQHISYHVSFNSIAESLKELGIEISKYSVFKTKEEIATLFKPNYTLIKEYLLNGNLIQVDETQIKMKGGKKGYIWVFSNMTSVFYLFRSDRKSSFLKEFLKDFKGILISDFYKGYDSLKCIQQKCIIHLLRDLNSDFHKNQLDIELKNIVISFGNLLKKIVATIDKYGLRKRNLHKHLKDVEIFYKNNIENKDYNSPLAVKYKNRLERYKSKLWVFLEHDNIPWHNNNAEYAIKSFAKHREKGNRIFTEASAKDYTVLASLEQTCKYRGVRFMDYLRQEVKMNFKRMYNYYNQNLINNSRYFRLHLRR